jgi:hypothetical protein
MDCIQLAQEGSSCLLCDRGDELSGSIKGGEFYDELSTYKIPKKVAYYRIT